MRVLLLTLTLLFALNATATAADLVIIGNKNFPNIKVNAGLVKKIYMGKVKKRGSVKLKPFDLADNSEAKKQFTSNLMGFRSVMKYNSFWIGKVFKEGGVPPVLKKTTGQLLEAIASTPGSIGYCFEDQLGNNPNIKILYKVK